jgi:hypothetical protein
MLGFMVRLTLRIHHHVMHAPIVNVHPEELGQDAVGYENRPSIAETSQRRCRDVKKGESFPIGMLAAQDG